MPPSPTSTLGQLVTSRETIDESVRVDLVIARLRNEPAIDALAVVDAAGRAVGLLDRNKLLMKLSHQYGHALFARAPLRRVLDRHVLIARAEEQLEPVLDRALARGEQELYDAIVVVDGDGKPLGLVSVKQLILQQSTALANSAMERELLDRRTQELEKLSLVKSAFIAHVTHELRSPVNAIIGISELLMRANRDGDAAKLDTLLALLTSSATSLRTLVTNVLDLSKLEAGRMEVLPEPFDVMVLVQDLAAVTRVLVGRKPVSVEVISRHEQAPWCSDPVKLKQILMNLLSNAAKFTDAGHIRIAVEVGETVAELSVSDTGMGIAPADLDAILQPFVQLADVHTRRHEGTGLGLTITARLLELIRGSLTISSEHGHGSTFRIQIPKLTEGAAV